MTQEHELKAARGIEEQQYRQYLRTILFLEQNGQCFYCGKTMWLPDGTLNRKGKKKRDMATLEHKTARSLGGTDELDNCVCSCQHCNSIKGSIPHDDFFHLRQLGVSWFLRALAYNEALIKTKQNKPFFVELDEVWHYRNWDKSEEGLRQKASKRRHRLRLIERLRTGPITTALRSYRTFVYV